MLRTEADVVRALRGSLTMDDIYRACWQRADCRRDGGLQPPDAQHAGDTRWKRRARGAVQGLRTSGRAERTGPGRWLLDGPPARATVFVLLRGDDSLGDVELLVASATDLLGSLASPCDLVLCDPPYGLGRGTREASDRRVYARDARQVVGGYVDVPDSAYRSFTGAWVQAAAAALRPGGQLAVVCGPQRAAHVQIAAEDAGLDWVTSIAARRGFALYHTRRPAPAHWTVTVMAAGGAAHPDRVFVPPDWQRARSGRQYPLDWWEDNGRSDRPGLLRYDNALPARLASRLVTTFSHPEQLVCDPFLGSGSTMLAARDLGRRFVGGDVNAHAVRFAAARLMKEGAYCSAEGVSVNRSVSSSS